MRTTKALLSRRLSRPLRRTAVVAALSLVGIFGAHAAENPEISSSEAVCLSCAFEDGLDRPAAAVLVAPELDAIDSAPGEARHDASESFASRGTERTQVILPSIAGNRSERLRFNSSEKALLWSFVSLSAVDAYQTMNAPGHVREANPLLASWAGDHPSTFETLAFKGATTYAMIKLTSKVKKRSTRRLALVLMNVVQLSVAAHNEDVTGGILF